MGGHVLLTDRAWPDAEVERATCEDAGLTLVDLHGAPRDALLAEAKDAVGILTNWVRVDREVIDHSPGLVAICRLGVGVDNIDVAAARARGIAVGRIPDYCVEEVSDHVLALVLDHVRRVGAYHRDVRAGGWHPGRYPQRRLSSLVVGVWGAGLTGRRTAAKFAALGCEVLIDDRHGPAGTDGVTAVPVDALLDRCDVLSLHLPLTPSTRGAVAAAQLARLRDGALVVNTSRGGVLDLDALRPELTSGRLAAALDVLPAEPLVPDWLRELDNVVLTPHVAFASRESVADLRRRASADLVSMIAGNPPTYPAPEVK